MPPTQFLQTRVEPLSRLHTAVGRSPQSPPRTFARLVLVLPAGEFGIVVGCLFHLSRGVQDFFEERNLLCFCREDEIGELVETMQLGDDLEGVTLPDQLTPG